MSGTGGWRLRTVVVVLACVATLLAGSDVLSAWWVFMSVVAVSALGRAYRLGAIASAMWMTGLAVSVGPAEIRVSFLVPILLTMHVLSSLRRGDSLREDWPGRPLVLLAVGWLGVQLVSSLSFAPNTPASLWALSQQALAVASLLLVGKLSNQDARAIILLGTVAGGLIATVSVVAYSLAYTLRLDFGHVVGVEALGRVVGLSFEPNILASHIVLWLGIMSASWAALPHRVRFFVVPLVLGVLLSETRAAWVALVVIGCVWAYLRWGMSRTHLVTAAVVGFAASCIWLIAFPWLSRAPYGSIWWRIGHLFDFQSGTGSYRLDIYRQAVGDLTDHHGWLLGLGTNAFSQMHELDATGVGPPYLSSVWLALVFDGGIIGALLFLLVLFQLWRSSANRVSMGGVIVALLICASVTNLAWFSYAWIALALVHRSPVLDDRTAGPTRANNSS